MLKSLSVAFALLLSGTAAAECAYDWAEQGLSAKVDEKGICQVNVENEWITEQELIYFMNLNASFAERDREIELDQMRTELDSRAPVFAQILPMDEFWMHVNALSRAYGDPDWVYYWEYTYFSWPLQFYDPTTESIVIIDHNSVFDYYGE